MPWRIFILSLACLANGNAVWADGGAVRLSQRVSTQRITVFTTPTPLRAGPIDVSVLVQDADSGKPLFDVPVRVKAHAADHSQVTISATATSEAATNKLMQAALLELAKPGWWHIDVMVGGAEIGFDVEVAAAAPAWLDMGLWIGWPMVAIAIFVVHRWLRHRHAKIHWALPGARP